MTLNLTASAPVLIGCPDRLANTCSSADAAVRKVSEFNGQTDDVIQCNVMHGELTGNHETARSKGGSESAISDLQVPSLSPSSSSWSWDHEEDRRRQEKWQEEQERLLQEQYQRDQERLEAEWRRAQQEAMGESCRKSGKNLFEMTNGGERPASAQPHVNGLTNNAREEERSPDRSELKGAASKPQSNARGAQDGRMTEQAWAKSLSTPALGGPYKQIRGDDRKRKGQSISKVEQERQLILEEMKKRTQLLTDNSWIRQRSSSFYKEPVYVGVPMKRFESLDNLDNLRQSPLSSLGYPRPHSAAAGYCAPSRNSSSRYSTGSTLSQRNASMDPSLHGGVWAATDISEELSMESRFESETGSCIASPAIATSRPLMPPPCDQHTVLHITE